MGHVRITMKFLAYAPGWMVMPFTEPKKTLEEHQVWVVDSDIMSLIRIFLSSRCIWVTQMGMSHSQWNIGVSCFTEPSEQEMEVSEYLPRVVVIEILGLNKLAKVESTGRGEPKLSTWYWSVNGMFLSIKGIIGWIKTFRGEPLD